jgi:parafibromin
MDTSADPLITLRQSIALSNTPILSTSSTPDSPTSDLIQAKSIHFLNILDKDVSFQLDFPTRFSSNDSPVDLRSIYFAWLQRDASGPDYISATRDLNENGAGISVSILLFAQRQDIISWLSGQQDESEYIAPLPSTGPTAGGLKAPKVDARLQEIYKGERKIQDRHNVLHGIKPTDFSSVRKQAAALLHASRSGSNAKKPTSTIPAASAPINLPTRKPGRQRQEPIILLSPSASALLRVSNVKQFLESGTYSPPSGTDGGTNLLYVSRNMPNIDPNRPVRFLLAESIDFLKPDDWARVVAVFTTGQLWQFKSYKWSSPTELFSRALGVYVGWTAEQVPDAVKGWGRAVKVVNVDKWTSGQQAALESGASLGRWKDSQVVESIWEAIEKSMRAKGWNRELGMVPANK